jgi:hypothetical protein
MSKKWTVYGQRCEFRADYASLEAAISGAKAYLKQLGAFGKKQACWCSVQHDGREVAHVGNGKVMRL